MNDLSSVVGYVIVGLVALLLAVRFTKGIVGLAVLAGIFYLNTLIVTALYVDPNVWEAECRAAQGGRERGCNGLEAMIALTSIVEFGILFSLGSRIFGRGGRQRRSQAPEGHTPPPR